MLGQLEIGFAMRVALGFILLVSVSYITYVYIENSEKVKMTQFLRVVSQFVTKEITTTVSEIDQNTSIYKRTYIPPAGDPFGGNYYIELEKDSNNVYVIVGAYRWKNIEIKTPLYLNPDLVNISGIAAPTLLCMNITRGKDSYDIALRC